MKKHNNDLQFAEIVERDKGAENFDYWYIKNKGRLYDWVEKRAILRELDLKKTDIVLDAGCGTGRFTIEIAKKVKKVYAVDFSQNSIEILNEKLRKEKIYNVETLVHNLLDPLPFNEQVDKIVSVQVIQHVPSTNNRNRLIFNLYEKLKQGGCLVITLYNWNWYAKFKNLSKEGYFENGIYYFRFTPDETKSMLEKGGFKKVFIRGCVNFKGYRILNNLGLYKFFYPLGIVDVLLSKFELSTSVGTYLLCKGIK